MAAHSFPVMVSLPELQVEQVDVEVLTGDTVHTVAAKALERMSDLEVLKEAQMGQFQGYVALAVMTQGARHPVVLPPNDSMGNLGAASGDAFVLILQEPGTSPDRIDQESPMLPPSPRLGLPAYQPPTPFTASRCSSLGSSYNPSDSSDGATPTSSNIMTAPSGGGGGNSKGATPDSAGNTAMDVSPPPSANPTPTLAGTAAAPAFLSGEEGARRGAGLEEAVVRLHL